MKVSKEEMQAKFIALGVPADYAPILAGMDVAISKGSEARLDDAVERVTGRKPKSFQTFAEEAKAAWIVVLNEIGLDPGIDHLYAMKLITGVHAKGGKVHPHFIPSS